jgi:anti-sigma B factor antagonist
VTTAESFDLPLQIAVRRAGAHHVVQLSGAASMDQVGLLHQRLRELLDEGAARLVLDLGGLAFISSSGLGAIISAHHAARDKGGGVRIAAVTPNLERMLRLTHIDQVIPLHPSVEAAIAAV